MRHFTQIIFTGLLLLSTVVYADAEKHFQDRKYMDNEGVGFGIGAIIGGLIAGPPGVVIGATGGSIFGNHKSKRDDAYASLEKILQQKNNELALLQNQLAQSTAQNRSPERAQTERSLRKVYLENKHSSLKTLGNGLSLSVFFRTNDAVIDNTLSPHLRELANLINEYPELKIQLFAHADHRGQPDYNMALSKSRAQSVRQSLIEAGVSGSRIFSHAHGETNAINKELEGLIFDRRVDIRLTVDTEV